MHFEFFIIIIFKTRIRENIFEGQIYFDLLVDYCL